jgi:hypothetical protein
VPALFRSPCCWRCQPQRRCPHGRPATSSRARAPAFRGALAAWTARLRDPATSSSCACGADVCDGTSAGIQPTASAHTATLVFTPPSGGPRNVLVLSTNCAAIEGDRLTCEGDARRGERGLCTAGGSDLALVERGRGAASPGPHPEYGRLARAGRRRSDIQRTGDARRDDDGLAAALRSGDVAMRGGERACPASWHAWTRSYSRDGTCRATADVIDPTFGSLHRAAAAERLSGRSASPSPEARARGTRPRCASRSTRPGTCSRRSTGAAC